MSIDNKLATSAPQAPATQEEIITSLVLEGDLSKMTPVQKVEYYNSFCKSLELNPLTQPFEIINLKGKLRMYATKSCTEQLRRLNGISITDLIVNQIGTSYTVTAKGNDKSGRVDASMAVLDIKGLAGENLANAMMKCETKAKRRLTLSMCGLGVLDETEVESIRNAENENRQQQAETNTASVPNAPALATEEDFTKLFTLINNEVFAEMPFLHFLQPKEIKPQVIKAGFVKAKVEGMEKSKADEYIKLLEAEIKYALDKQTTESTPAE